MNSFSFGVPSIHLSLFSPFFFCNDSVKSRSPHWFSYLLTISLGSYNKVYIWVSDSCSATILQNWYHHFRQVGENPLFLGFSYSFLSSYFFNSLFSLHRWLQFICECIQRFNRARICLMFCSDPVFELLVVLGVIHEPASINAYMAGKPRA